jgi:hypothetical protein
LSVTIIAEMCGMLRRHWFGTGYFHWSLAGPLMVALTGLLRLHDSEDTGGRNCAVQSSLDCGKHLTPPVFVPAPLPRAKSHW